MESFAGGYAGGQWKDIVVFGILILFPARASDRGWLGAKAIQKV